MSAISYRLYLFKNIPKYTTGLRSFYSAVAVTKQIRKPETIKTYSFDNIKSIQSRFLHLTMANSNNKVVSYEDVVSYKNKTDVLLIDVREPQELIDTGIIPASINIPLGDLTKTLQEGSPDEFKKKYNREFPSKNIQLVFTCKMGGRAGKAMDAAVKLGYVNSKFYEGSWLDWASRQSN